MHVSQGLGVEETGAAKGRTGIHPSWALREKQDKDGEGSDVNAMGGASICPGVLT